MTTQPPRTIAQIVADVERQIAREHLLRILPTDLRRLVGAAVQGDLDALRLAALVPEVKEVGK